MPPVVGPTTISTLLPANFSTNPRQARSVARGRRRRSNFSTYCPECRPDESKKCPSLRAPASRRTSRRSLLTETTPPADRSRHKEEGDAKDDVECQQLSSFKPIGLTIVG